MNLSQGEIKQLNDLTNLLSYQQTWAYLQYVHLPHRVIALFTGNQSMKTSSTAYQYVLRIWGKHPVPHKNFLYFECPDITEARLAGVDDKHPLLLRKFNNGVVIPFHKKGQYTIDTRPEDNICGVCGRHVEIKPRGTSTYRFMSEVLPSDKASIDDKGQSAEVRNAQYPEFKKWLPPFLIKKDIVFRDVSMTLRDPNAGRVFGDIEYEGKDIIVEFVSYAQTAQTGAGVQRLSSWSDEEPPYAHYEEQLPRLLAEDGDFILTLTPAERMSWTGDEFLERAEHIIRTQAICDFFKSEFGEIKDRVEKTLHKTGIAVIQASTDDNPTLAPDVINAMFERYDDPDVVAIRRYGIHKQVHGKIFKGFDWNTHFIPAETVA